MRVWVACLVKAALLLRPEKMAPLARTDPLLLWAACLMKAVLCCGLRPQPPLLLLERGLVCLCCKYRTGD